MEQATNSGLPTELEEALKAGHLLPIVAAGVSMSVLGKDGQCLFPSWETLLRNAAAYLKASDDDSKKLGSAIDAMLDIDKYQSAAEIAREGLTGDTWVKFIDREFNHNLSEVDLGLPKAIWALSNNIITLNYDKVMEKSCPTEPLSVIDNQSKMEMNSFTVDTGSAALWHLHGRLDNKEHIILTPSTYESLYCENSKYPAAIQTLKNLVSTKHCLFIGCSMDDVELLEKFAQQNTIFSDNTGPHFILVKASDKVSLQLKLKDCGVNFKYICFDDFGQPLLDTVQKIIELKPHEQPKIVPHSNKSLKTVEKFCQIAVLSAQPLDKDIGISTALTALKKLKADVHYLPLSQTQLNMLEAMDYVILLSHSASDGLWVEGESLHAEPMSLIDIADNIDCSELKGLFVLTDKPIENVLLLENMTDPVMVIPHLENKKAIDTFIFQVFKKHAKAFDFEDGIQVFAKDAFQLQKLTGRQQNPISHETPLPSIINKVDIDKVVGRENDIEAICDKLIRLSRTGGIFSIKGAGGLGKTTCVQKALVALARHGLFAKGLNFIDASPIVDFEYFQNKCLEAFGLNGVQEAMALIQTQQFQPDKRLIVVDNAESLLSKPYTDEILSLLKQLSPFCSIIVTTREVLGIETIKPLELREFNADEAETLFLQESGYRPRDSEDRAFLRKQILEEQLGNHPLAITLIASDLPHGKNLGVLYEELSKSSALFEQENKSLREEQASQNIQRQDSIFSCIAYSYQQLNNDEKTALQMLALFPDGLPLEQLKAISQDQRAIAIKGKQQPYMPINDKVIKTLQNKSLVTNNYGTQRQHALVRRFTQEKINQQADRKKLYRRAFSHNRALAQSLSDNLRTQSPRVFRLASQVQHNLMLAIEYASQCEIEWEELIDYIESASFILQGCQSRTALIRVLQSLPEFNDALARLYIEILILHERYYNGDFVNAYYDLQQLISIEELSGIDQVGWLQRSIVRTATRIYRMEGHVLASLHNELERLKYSPKQITYSEVFLLLGEYDLTIMRLCNVDYALFEAQRNIGQLDVESLQLHFNELFHDDHIDRMQCYFIISKTTKADIRVLDQLQVVNPYTAGLKQLMLASLAEAKEAHELYQQAIENLYHIRYYHVEAQLLYCRFLKQQSHEHFQEQFNGAISLAKKHCYRFLCHQLLQLEMGTNEDYYSENFPLPEDVPMEEFKRIMLKSLKNKRG